MLGLRAEVARVRVAGPGHEAVGRRVDVSDQRHALEVYGRLRAATVTDPSALAAALLHDCGKGAVPVWLLSNFLIKPLIFGDA